MSQYDHIEKYVECSVGQTFYVSFAGIYDGTQDVTLAIEKPGGNVQYRHLGKVSAFALNNVSPDDEANYWFGSNERQKDGTYFFVYRLCVSLTIRSSFSNLVFVNAGDIKKMLDDYWRKLFCIQEKTSC